MSNKLLMVYVFNSSVACSSPSFSLSLDLRDVASLSRPLISTPADARSILSTPFSSLSPDIMPEDRGTSLKFFPMNPKKSLYESEDDDSLFFYLGSNGEEEVEEETEFHETLIVEGSQSISYERHCDGTFSYALAKKIIECLNQHKTSSTDPIYFDEKRLERSEIKGGTCTAMALHFASLYIEDSAGLSNVAFESMMKRSFTELFLGSNKIYRTMQAALNTITISPASPLVDLSAKIDRISRLHNLMITSSSKIFCADPIDEMFEDTIARLTPGFHFLRLVNPPLIFPTTPLESILKDESYGHSMILTKKEDALYLYDPNKGVYKINRFTSNPGKWIAEKINSYVRIHKFDRVQIMELKTYV